ncbi:hypothetical protein BS47DRAFT_591849 [Hydnum rufescens UP504]|uniref:Homeobox domain-containing protein n=1 Tax=Hydnum rufescens UP504 TaxID=1448309 RepID=A0A9P6B420_9AGAM|nr:hypothetical protein BS47DRAFT_591849 [Hydnum rufescens UP504]
MANGVYDRLQTYSGQLCEPYPSPPIVYSERQPIYDPLEGGIMTRSRRNTAPTTMQSLPQGLYPSVAVDSHYTYATEPSGPQVEDSPLLDAQPVSPPGPPSEEASGGGESESSHNPSGSRTGKRKRSRVTPAQLAQLERAFSKDRSPTAARRKEISEMLGMQERQTQVWFQNRRAKAKLLEQRARSGHLASHSRADYPGMVSVPLERDGDLQALLHEDDPIFIIPCNDLSIGTFRRISAGVHDLVGYICESKRCLAWFIFSAGTGFKMEMPYDSISATEYADGVPSGQGRAAFLLTRPPRFTVNPRSLPRQPRGRPGPGSCVKIGRKATKHLRVYATRW